MKKQSLNGNNWKLKKVSDYGVINATVPGTVYTDLLRAGAMEDPFFKTNEDKALLLMESDYEYLYSFIPDESVIKEDNVNIIFEGVDTIASIYLNDVLLFKCENMHRHYERPVKDILKKNEKNELRVYLHSPVKYINKMHELIPTKGSEDAMPGFMHIRKAHYMFGWDWGAHLPDAGIFRPVYLYGYSHGKIDSCLISQKHSENYVTLSFAPSIEGEGDFKYRITVTSPNGDIYSSNGEDIEIDSPLLWWPNGFGKQYLYNVKVELMLLDSVIDTYERKIGLRTITMSREKLSVGGEEFATTVNNIKIFAMGADYIPEDHLLGRVSKEKTRSLLEKAVFANHNVIRVWGGGLYPEDYFYDLCDELGLIVWQDFMFACSMYELTDEFEKNIKEEIKENIIRLRHHASLGLFSGNNEMELFTKLRTWVSKESEIRDYIIMYERIIPKLVKEFAPEVYYWSSSPSSGGSFDFPGDPERGDQHFWEVWHGDKPFTEYRKHLFRYCSEFGFQSFPSEKTIDTITDSKKDKNIFSYVMERHQRSGSGNGKIMNYLQKTFLYPTDFNTLIYASQLLQAEGIKFGVEHFRRNRGICMGAVIWQLNDCWPVASWSSIDYYGRLKALHYYEKRFFAPIIISCEEEGMVNMDKPINWYPYDFNKSIRLAVSNETLSKENLTVKRFIRNAGAEILDVKTFEIEVEPLSSAWLTKEDMSELDIFNEYISYEVLKKDEVISDGTEILSLPKYFNYENPHLICSVEGDEITVYSKAYAKGVEISNDTDDLILSDNFFDMNGGTKKVKILSGNPFNLKVRSVYDIK